MKKILPIKFEKIWGWELWLYSNLKGKETKFEDGQPTTQDGPLIKIIYTTQSLSIQVHPDDEWAQKLENLPNGKSESWYVLDTLSDEASLCVGMKNYDRKEIIEAIREGKFEDMLDIIKVKKDEFFDIPAGLVHGIGKDIVIFEVQQPSDTTYRYYDFNRLENGKPRELHLDKAITVQKKLSYVNKPTIKDGIATYENIVGKQHYGSGDYAADSQCLFIDLISYETFILEKGECASAKKYCAVPF